MGRSRVVVDYSFYDIHSLSLYHAWCEGVLAVGAEAIKNTLHNMVIQNGSYLSPQHITCRFAGEMMKK